MYYKKAKVYFNEVFWQMTQVNFRRLAWVVRQTTHYRWNNVCCLIGIECKIVYTSIQPGHLANLAACRVVCLSLSSRKDASCGNCIVTAKIDKDYRPSGSLVAGSLYDASV